MTKEDPKFSIIIPTYNRASFILRTIESVLAQSYTNFEVIIVDDGSTDDTKSVVENLKEERLHYLWKKNGERAAARNFGVKQAKGKIITFIDSDDLFYPNHLEVANKFIAINPNTDIFHLAYEMRESESNNLIRQYNHRSGDLNQLILKGNILSCIGVFLKKEIAIKHPFNENRNLSGTEDWLLWLQLAARYSFQYSNEITACMIEHNSRSVMNFTEKELLYRTNILVEELKKDTVFLKKFGSKAINRIHAHMLTYTSLHLALSNKKRSAIKYFFSAIPLSIKEVLFKKRTLAIAKHLL